MNSNFQIIYLNGPSSVGKSSLAKRLQEALQTPFLHIGIDSVIELMPEKLNNWEGLPAPLGFSWKSVVDETGQPAHEIEMGPFAKKIVKTFKELVLTLIKMGHSVIIDDVALGKPQIDLWRDTLKEYKVLFVGIHAPLEILEEREKIRGNRMHGSARAQYFQVHKGVLYDLEFDTSKEPLESIVEKIKTHSTNHGDSSC